MNKLNRKWFITTTVLILVLSLLAACSNNDANQASSSIAPSASNSTDAKKELVLDIWSTFATDAAPLNRPEDDVVGNYVYQKTKVKVGNFFGNGGTDWGPKLTTMIAGGTLPNIVDNHAGQGTAQFAKLAEGNLIWELTPEMLEKYAPNIWSKVPQSQWEKIKVNGKIYGVPYNIPLQLVEQSGLDDAAKAYFNNSASPVTTGQVWIRDDILRMIYPNAKSYDELMAVIQDPTQKIGDLFMDVPIKTTQEYIDLMYKIKDLNLKEGDKTVHVLGYNSGDNWPALTILGPEMFGAVNYNYLTHWSVDSQEIKFGLTDPTWKEMAQIQNKMVRDKVIDPESLVHTQAQYKEKAIAGTYAMLFPQWAAGNGDELNKLLEQQNKSYRYRPLVVQIPRNAEFPNYSEPVWYSSSRGILKTVTEEDVPQVLQWMDFFFTDEFEEIYNWGPKEAGLYEDLADGKRKYSDDEFQRYFVKGEAVWEPQEMVKKSKGIKNVAGDMHLINEAVSKWDPKYMNGEIIRSLWNEGLKFNPGSPYAQEATQVPPMQMWAPEYGDLDIVKKFWEVRQSWEDPVRIAFTAKSDEDFEKKWSNAMNKFEELDVHKLKSEMTAIAVQLAKDLKLIK